MIILCSASPRRKEILDNLGLTFDIHPAEIDENEITSESPLEYLKRISFTKADAVKKSLNFQSISNPLFIACDTIVVYEGRILHKPENFDQAMEILSLLSGKKHQVYSGITLLKSNDIYWDCDETRIQFKSWNNESIRSYIENSKPFDKAGAYGIQDRNSPVESYEGSYTNVMGFPIRKFFKYWELWTVRN